MKAIITVTGLTFQVEVSSDVARFVVYAKETDGREIGQMSHIVKLDELTVPGHMRGLLDSHWVAQHPRGGHVILEVITVDADSLRSQPVQTEVIIETPMMAGLRQAA